MFPASHVSSSPVYPTSHSMNVQSDKAIKNDSTYETQLKHILADSYTIVFVGHSGKGYLQPDVMRKAMENEISKIMLDRRLLPEQVTVVAGGTAEGIGEVYSVARGMGIETLGIVAAQGKDYKSANCDSLITVDNGNPDDWSTKLPQSREELVVTALRIANSGVGLGGQLLAFNGGRQAYEETLAAARQGFPVTIVDDFDPVDASREQPFKMFAEMECLLNAIHDTRRTGTS